MYCAQSGQNQCRMKITMVFRLITSPNATLVPSSPIISTFLASSKSLVVGSVSESKASASANFLAFFCFLVSFAFRVAGTSSSSVSSKRDREREAWAGCPHASSKQREGRTSGASDAEGVTSRIEVDDEDAPLSSLREGRTDMSSEVAVDGRTALRKRSAEFLPLRRRNEGIELCDASRFGI